MVTLRSSCRRYITDIVLAPIGPGWAGNTDPKTGQRRLEDPKDFVRIEICAALSRTIPVIPVLLDNAPMPNAEQLPEDMRKLVGRQAGFVGYRTFDADGSSGELGLAMQGCSLVLGEQLDRRSPAGSSSK